VPKNKEKMGGGKRGKKTLGVTTGRVQRSRKKKKSAARARIRGEGTGEMARKKSDPSTVVCLKARDSQIKTEKREIRKRTGSKRSSLKDRREKDSGGEGGIGGIAWRRP